MATKEEIIAGLELTVSQAKRTTSLFAEGEYDWKRAGGWTPKEMYTHLAAVTAVIPRLGQGLAAAPEGTDIATTDGSSYHLARGEKCPACDPVAAAVLIRHGRYAERRA